jgi:hypothetical protein
MIRAQGPARPGRTPPLTWAAGRAAIAVTPRGCRLPSRRCAFSAHAVRRLAAGRGCSFTVGVARHRARRREPAGPTPGPSAAARNPNDPDLARRALHGGSELVGSLEGRPAERSGHVRRRQPCQDEAEGVGLRRGDRPRRLAEEG